MFDVEEFLDEIAQDFACPACGGEGMFLGNLGSRAHFRCRDCGIGFSVEVED